MKRSTIEITERKQLLVQLVAGLLSGSHYTEIATHEEYAIGHFVTEPRLKSYESGFDNWRELGCPRKHPFYVIADAEYLLADIEFIVDQEAK
jgi:hypothetical protein